MVGNRPTHSWRSPRSWRASSGAERAASLEWAAPHELVRDFVKARDALAVRELCALVFPGGSSRNLCLATLRGDGGGEAEPGGPTWLAALDAADDEFLRELVVHGPPPHCTPSEEAEAAFYEGLGEATRPVVGLRAAHPALRLRAARDAAALKLDVGDALAESGALLAALEADAAWARASCVARASLVAVAQLLVRPRAAVPRGLPRGGAVRFCESAGRATRFDPVGWRSRTRRWTRRSGRRRSRRSVGTWARKWRLSPPSRWARKRRPPSLPRRRTSWSWTRRGAALRARTVPRAKRRPSQTWSWTRRGGAKTRRRGSGKACRGGGRAGVGRDVGRSLGWAINGPCGEAAFESDTS